MSDTEPAVRLEGVGKTYACWTSPQARLGGSLLRRVARARLLPRGVRARAQRAAAGASFEVPALADVSLELPRGETLAVIGRNGSGKSTLLQIVAGTLAPSAGRIERSGRVAALLELGSGFHPEFSGRENARLNAALLGLTPDEVEARLEPIARFADLGEFIDRPVRTYSSGMVVRLAFSVSVHVEADLLLVDEALSVGDAGFQFKCLERLHHLQEQGVALLFVSHDMVTVKSFCPRALYLEAGRMKAYGPTEEVCEQYFLDVRNAQRRSACEEAELVPRPALGPGGRLSFGGAEGRIVEVRFLDAQGRPAGRSAAVGRGEPVGVEAEVALADGVTDTTLSLVLASQRLIPVAGRRQPLPANGMCRVRYSFAAQLAPGRYFLTLRLERGRVPHLALLVDKQTAALELEVLPRPGEVVLGFCDLGIEAQVGAPAAPSDGPR